VGKVLILISGSDEKSTTQETDFQHHPLLDQFSPSLREKLITTRRIVKNLIQSGKLYDFKVKDENRTERESNRKIINGPDFGGSEIKPIYLPAFKRYHGRFFNQLNEEDWNKASEKGYFIFVLTPLYGFVGPMDSIQNYNCYFSDSIIETIEVEEFSKTSLSNIWSEILTESLDEFIKTHNIHLIIDLLTDEISQNLILWKKLSKTNTLHRIFKEKSGPAILPNIRKFFKNDIISLNSEAVTNAFQANTAIEKDYFKEDVLIFENTIGEIITGYAREEFKYNTRLSRYFPIYWRRFSKIERDALSFIEELYEKFEHSNLKRHLTTAIIQAYWGILEFCRKCFLNSLIESFKSYSSEIEDEMISLPRKVNISIFELIRRISIKDCTNFHAYNTQFILEQSLRSYHTSSKFLQFVSNKLGRGLIQNFVKNYNTLRIIRNEYKCINSQKDINEIKNDLDKFRLILFNEENSPIVLFEKFEERLCEDYYLS